MAETLVHQGFSASAPGRLTREEPEISPSQVAPPVSAHRAPAVAVAAYIRRATQSARLLQ